MKKIGILLLVISCLLGCQKKVEVTELNASTSYTLQEQLSFELIKTEVVESIAPSNKNKTYKYMKPTSEDSIFVDVVLKTVNLAKQQNLEDLYQGKMQVNGQDYDIQLAIESVNYNQLSTADVMKEYETRYVHLYCEVPKVDIKGDIDIEFNALGKQKYKYTFKATENIMKTDEKNIGDVLSLEQSQIVFNSINLVDKIEPSHKGFFYNYIPTDHKDETFVVLQIDLKNISNKELNPSDYIYCEYQYDQQSIQSKIIIESEDHQSLSKTGTVKTSDTRTLYIAMPILKKDIDKSGMIELFVEGQVYKLAYN